LLYDSGRPAESDSACEAGRRAEHHADQQYPGTIVNSGETFQYHINFPENEPSGLYWYHPHTHGVTEHAVQGGASGAIIVDGIENIQLAVSGLRERILMVRDQPVPGNPAPKGNIPSWDLTLNYIAITSPTDPNSNNFVPAILHMEPGEKQFWRLTNSSSDTILDLQYVFDGVLQTIQVVAIDGVPVNSQDSDDPGRLIPVTHFVLPPASRVEFIVSAPSSAIKLAQLITLAITTGPDGDNDPQRALASIQLSGSVDSSGDSDNRAGTFTAMSKTWQLYKGLGSAPVAVKRTVYFDEIQPTKFFNNFELNGYPQAPAIIGQYLDMIQVPAWDKKDPYPSVTLRIDFRGPDIGDFIFHCHILNHEDLGMMNIIRVQRAPR
jgi:FtsP/CotA-like multicopper oxidase with cupredoxin domain